MKTPLVNFATLKPKGSKMLILAHIDQLHSQTMTSVAQDTEPSGIMDFFRKGGDQPLPLGREIGVQWDMLRGNWRTLLSRDVYVQFRVLNTASYRSKIVEICIVNMARRKVLGRSYALGDQSSQNLKFKFQENGELAFAKLKFYETSEGVVMALTARVSSEEPEFRANHWVQLGEKFE